MGKVVDRWDMIPVDYLSGLYAIIVTNLIFYTHFQQLNFQKIFLCVPLWFSFLNSRTRNRNV